MECASNYIRVNKPALAPRLAAGPPVVVTDTNILALNFRDIPKYKDLLMLGDPHSCKVCGAYFNFKSEVAAPLLEEEKVAGVAAAKEWMCEFCGGRNIVKIEANELPKKHDCYYLLEAAAQAEAKEESKSEKVENQDASSVLFVLDNSGSMNESADNKNRESRKACIERALRIKLNELKKKCPNKKVGLVLFTQGVTIYGDCSNAKPVTLEDSFLDNYDACFEAGAKSAGTHIQKKISESYDGLTQLYESIRPNGWTALGPAVVTALGIASKGLPGSQIILCTDGLANKGLGALENNGGQGAAFYEKVAADAKQRGVSISVITLKGTIARIEILSRLAEVSSGSILRVSPSTILDDLGEALEDELVATNVEVNILLHYGLKFRDEDPTHLKKEGSLLSKHVGNVTSMSEHTFEYDIKSTTELARDELSLTNLKEIPIQAQISFTSKSGDKCLRVITVFQSLTEEEGKAEAEAKIDVIAARVMKKAANQALVGDARQAQVEAHGWGDYLSKVGQMQPTNVQAQHQLNQYSMMNQMIIEGAQAMEQESNAPRGNTAKMEDQRSNLLNMRNAKKKI